MSAREEPKAALPDPAEGSARKPALKDRIADLNLGQRAKAVGASLADRMKAVQSAAEAIRLDKLNRDKLKAGRDGLAAKVEALLKPRQPHGEPPAPGQAGGVNETSAPEQPSPPATSGAGSDTDSATGAPREPDIRALKAKLDQALRTSTVEPPLAAVQPATPPPQTLPPQTVGPHSPAEAMRSERVGIDDTPPAAAPFAPGSAPAPIIETIPAPASEPRTTRTARARAAAEVERRRPIISLFMIATALVAGGVLHILTVFTIPFLNTGSAFDRLRWDLERNVMRVFSADPDGRSPLPFLSADMRYAMCRYDLTEGSVFVSAMLPDIGWSLTLYTPQGDNFYAVPGQDGKPVTAAFSLNLASDRLLLPVPGMRRADTDAAQVTSPQREGLIVIRAPNLGPAYQPTLEDALKRASCRPAPRR